MEVTFKKCFKCGLILPISAFYAHPRMLDGHLNKCKTCTRKDVHERYEENIKDKDFLEKERARGRDKYKRLGYKDREHAEYSKPASNSRRNFEAKYGRVSSNIELHHWNYNYLDELIPVDKRIHHRLHKLIRINKDEKFFTVISTGEKLDTMGKHCDFIERTFQKHLRI